MKELLQVGLKSCAAAMIAAVTLGGQVSSAQDWKAQPDPKITGKLDLRQISGTGCRVLTGFAGQTDGGRWGVLATYELSLPGRSGPGAGVHAARPGPDTVEPVQELAMP